MSLNATFNPTYGSGVVVAPSSVSATSSLSILNDSVCLTNLGSTACFVKVGAAGITATSADYVVPPLAQVTITKFQDHNTIAYVTASGTTSLHIMTGAGF